MTDDVKLIAREEGRRENGSTINDKGKRKRKKINVRQNGSLRCCR